jgi:hypothetical protein
MKTPKKTVRASTLSTLLREWHAREEFCRREALKLPRGGRFREVWVARAAAINRCCSELREKIEG